MSKKIHLFGKKYDSEYIASLIFTKRDDIFSWTWSRYPTQDTNDFISYPYFKGNTNKTRWYKPTGEKEITITYTPYCREWYIEIQDFLKNWFQEIENSLDLCFLNNLDLPKKQISLSYSHSKWVHIRGKDIEKFIIDNNINLEPEWRAHPKRAKSHQMLAPIQGAPIIEKE